MLSHSFDSWYDSFRKRKKKKTTSAIKIKRRNLKGPSEKPYFIARRTHAAWKQVYGRQAAFQ